jgi:hypothetical protein
MRSPSSGPILRSQYLYGHGYAPRRHACRSRSLRGRITGVGDERLFYGTFGLGSSDNSVSSVTVTSSTNARTSRTDGVPRLAGGMAVRLKALKCRGRVSLIARSITSVDA